MSDDQKPDTLPVLARDVVPYEWGLWCSVVTSKPFTNEIEAVRWSEDGTKLWFLLSSFNFYDAAPDDVLHLVPIKSAWRTPAAQAKTRMDHAQMIQDRPIQKK